ADGARPARRVGGPDRRHRARPRADVPAAALRELGVCRAATDGRHRACGRDGLWRADDAALDLGGAAGRDRRGPLRRRAGGRGDGGCGGVVEEGLTGARMMELLAEELPGLEPGRAFTVGLLSALDALLDLPLEQAVGSIGLPDEMASAIVSGGPPYGALLRRV